MPLIEREIEFDGVPLTLSQPFRRNVPGSFQGTGRTSMETATSLTLSQAAHATNVPNSTIWRSIKSGRLNASRDDAGTYRIEASELFKCFPSVVKQDGEGEAVGEARQRLAPVEQELRARVSELERDRDAWRDQAQRLALVAAQPRTLWRWLRSRG